MNSTEQRVLDAIDIDGLLALLCELIAIPSLDGTPEELAVQQRVAEWMHAAGLEVDTWELDFATLYQHPQASWEVERARGLGVVGMLGTGQGGRSLIFNGHTDVVPAGDTSNWHFLPFVGTIADGRVYGRGSVDMKGGLCCALLAAKALNDAGVRLNGRLMIQSVIGEEDGGIGTLAAVLRGYTADGAVIMEPTELRVAPAQAGALNFRLTIPGLAAHGCVREEGVSAIEKFFPIYAALMELERERNAHATDPLYARYTLPYALCIGTLRAGTWASSVAESLVCEGRYGVAVGEDIPAAQRRFEACVVQAAQADPWLREHPPIVEWWGGRFEPAAIATEHPLATTVAEAFHDATAGPARFEGMTYGADMRLLVNVGHTPTVMFGPGDVRVAHRPDEFVPIADLVAVTRTLALTALRFCGYADKR
ncbi:MAG: ArgE/DapE family deacylase [Chloroflexi bacterium SZAS-1]|nr:ArgE/DapE family deacylase [Chloroflexi bacterium SZAS-1]